MERKGGVVMVAWGVDCRKRLDVKSSDGEGRRRWRQDTGIGRWS